MAKAKDARPFFSVKFEYEASVERFAHQAGMLADAVQMILIHDLVDAKAKATLQARLDEFKAAQFGEDE